eukprot:CAMPEP_0181415386 /NCGR_PEP_ID=MMETSP1110-20121109/9991_1 /TAXON_ID=174948 /ORGANISM="Symbiodinium sp., Strain CCMP421" /LENGTH=122 /DNA_ID=CAMNT_0023538289 /DNA_START=88 /DNA_END=457 /DNA_ORIENTATION=-
MTSQGKSWSRGGRQRTDACGPLGLVLVDGLVGVDVGSEATALAYGLWLGLQAPLAELVPALKNGPHNLRRETIVRDLSAIIMRVEQRQAAILHQAVRIHVPVHEVQVGFCEEVFDLLRHTSA